MESLIVDLQKDIFEGKDIKSILTKALMVSNELELSDFNEWINLELMGYKDNMDKLPDYRKLECEVRGNFMEQVGFNLVTTSNAPISNLPDEINKQLRDVQVYQSILELIHICDIHHETVRFKPDFKIENLLKSYLPNAIEIYRVCPIFQLEAIIDRVRNEIMNWCSELKKNDIYGESYSFTTEEIETAKTINYNIILNNSKIHVEDSNFNISYKQDILINLEGIKNVLKENSVDNRMLTEINNQIIIIEQELEKDIPDVDKMENASKYMRDFIMQVMTGAVANLLLQYINPIIQVLLTIQLPM